MTIHSDIDKIFKQGLSDYSEKAPSFVWDNIEQQLNNKRNKTKKFTLYAIAASAALLLSFGAGYLFTDKSNNTQFAQVENTDVKSSIKNTTATVENKNKPSTDINNSAKKETLASQPIKNTTPSQKLNQPINSTSPKQDKEQDNNQQPPKKSKVKKANSSGILLPPMFANQSAFENSNQATYNNTDIIQSNNDNALTELAAIEPNMMVPMHEKDLVYEIREMPMLPLEDEKAKPNKEYSNWLVGISGTPLLSYRHVKSSSSEVMYSSVNNSGMQQDYNNEKPLISYSAGVNVGFNISERWNIQSGFYYSETGQVIENIYIDNTPYGFYNDANTNYEINTSAGNIHVKESPNNIISQVSNSDNREFISAPPSDMDESINMENEVESSSANFIQSLEYYELPLIINYKVIDRKLDIKLAGGFSASFLAGNNTYLDSNGDRIDIDADLDGIKSTSYSSVVGIGLEYPIVSKLLLNLNPTFRYSLNSINSSGNTHPYSFGVYTGIKYSF